MVSIGEGQLPPSGMEDDLASIDVSCDTTSPPVAMILRNAPWSLLTILEQQGTDGLEPYLQTVDIVTDCLHILLRWQEVGVDITQLPEMEMACEGVRALFDPYLGDSVFRNSPALELDALAHRLTVVLSHAILVLETDVLHEVLRQVLRPDDIRTPVYSEVMYERIDWNTLQPAIAQRMERDGFPPQLVIQIARIPWPRFMADVIHVFHSLLQWEVVDGLTHWNLEEAYYNYLHHAFQLADYEEETFARTVHSMLIRYPSKTFTKILSEQAVGANGGEKIPSDIWWAKELRRRGYPPRLVARLYRLWTPQDLDDCVAALQALHGCREDVELAVQTYTGWLCEYIDRAISEGALTENEALAIWQQVLPPLPTTMTGEWGRQWQHLLARMPFELVERIAPHLNGAVLTHVLDTGLPDASPPTVALWLTYAIELAVSGEEAPYDDTVYAMVHVLHQHIHMQQVIHPGIVKEVQRVIRKIMWDYPCDRSYPPHARLLLSLFTLNVPPRYAHSVDERGCLSEARTSMAQVSREYKQQVLVPGVRAWIQEHIRGLSQENDWTIRYAISRVADHQYEWAKLVLTDRQILEVALDAIRSLKNRFAEQVITQVINKVIGERIPTNKRIYEGLLRVLQQGWNHRLLYALLSKGGEKFRVALRPVVQEGLRRGELPPDCLIILHQHKWFQSRKEYQERLLRAISRVSPKSLFRWLTTEDFLSYLRRKRLRQQEWRYISRAIHQRAEQLARDGDPATMWALQAAMVECEKLNELS